MPVAYRAARVLTDSAADIVEDGVVIVDGDIITDVGPWSSVGAGLQECKVKDLGDVTLMPGLFDCHVHLQLDPTTMSTTKVAVADEELLPLMAKHATKLLDAGVTTARDLGSRGTTAITIRNRILSHEIPGPRLQCANAPLTVPGGHACSMGGECIGVQECRRMVKLHKAEGAEVVKVMATGGFLTPGTHVWEARYSQEEMDAMADEARKCELPITTHAIGTEGIARAVKARFNCIEHCSFLSSDRRAKFDPDIAKDMVRNNVSVCPTMNTACSHDNYFCPWDAREVVIDTLSSLRKAGVNIVVGTDSGIGHCHFERYADGLFAMSDAGFSNREIIAAATEKAAKVCRLENVTGKIVKGLAADLAAFAGNPLDELKAFESPRFVMARGEEYQQQAIPPLEDLTQIKNQVFKMLRDGAGI